MFINRKGVIVTGHLHRSSIVLKTAICDLLSLAHSMVRPIKSELKTTLIKVEMHSYFFHA